MSDEDWTKLTRRMSEISDLPVFIDRPSGEQLRAAWTHRAVYSNWL
jgi:replicative DNA helicase